MEVFSKNILRLIAFAILLSSAVLAQTKEYSLESLIKLGVKKNTDMLIAKGNQSIAKLEKTKATASLLPEINAEGSYIHTTANNGVPVFVGANGVNEILAFVSLKQTIFNPDIIYNYKVSSVRKKEEVYLNKQTKQNVINKVIDQYFNVLKYQNEKKIFEDNLKAFKLMYEQSKVLFESGTVPEIDVKKSKVELLLQKNALNQADKNYTAALNKLKELTGIDLKKQIKLKDFESAKVILNSEDYYKQVAWQNRPDWKLAQQESELSSVKTSLTFMKHFPIVSGNLYYGWDVSGRPDKQNLGFQAVVSASLPLWHWGAITAGKQIAEIEHQQITFRTRRLKVQILQEIENNYNEAKLQKEQIAAMRESKSEAKLAVEMAMAGYKEGTITNLDLINTQKLYTQTEMEYLKALYNFYIAKANLFKSIGKLKEDLSWSEE
jgi:outer membrane protein